MGCEEEQVASRISSSSGRNGLFISCRSHWLLQEVYNYRDLSELFSDLEDQSKELVDKVKEHPRLCAAPQQPVSCHSVEQMCLHRSTLTISGGVQHFPESQATQQEQPVHACPAAAC